MKSLGVERLHFLISYMIYCILVFGVYIDFAAIFIKYYSCGDILWAWYLLGDTVDVATTEQDFARVNRFDSFVREEFLERIDCSLIVRIVEDGQNHRAVTVIIINIAGGQAIAFVARESALNNVDALRFFFGNSNWVRNMNLDDFELAAFGIGFALEVVKSGFGTLVLRILFIIFPS